MTSEKGEKKGKGEKKTQTPNFQPSGAWGSGGGGEHWQGQACFGCCRKSLLLPWGGEIWERESHLRLWTLNLTPGAGVALFWGSSWQFPSRHCWEACPS